MVTKEKHKQLIDAVNLIAEYVGESLSAGWSLSIVMVRGEATLELVDPKGNEVEYGDVDHGESSLVAACEASYWTKDEEQKSGNYPLPRTGWFMQEGDEQ